MKNKKKNKFINKRLISTRWFTVRIYENWTYGSQYFEFFKQRHVFGGMIIEVRVFKNYIISIVTQ